MRAVQLVMQGPPRAVYEAVCLLRDTLMSGVDDAHYHTLSLGTVPLLWGQLQKLQAIVDSTAPHSGPQDDPALQLAEATLDAVAEALDAVESTPIATHYIAAAGNAPLRWHLFVTNTDTLLIDVDGEDEGGGGGAMRRIDGGPGGGPGGGGGSKSPAFL